MQRRIRSIIFLLVVLAQVATVGVLLLSLNQFRAQAVDEQMSLALTRSADRTSEIAYEELRQAEYLVGSSSELLAQRAVVPTDLIPTFMSAIDTYPQLAGVYIGLSDGSFFYVYRSGDGFTLKVVNTGNSDHNVTTSELSPTGQVVYEQISDEDYDPRTRPWYQLAEGQPGAADWTDPYFFFTSGNLGVTVSEGIVVNGVVVGVVGADIELTQLSENLADSSSGTAGGAVIFSQKGTVVAHSTPDLTQTASGNGEKRPVQITEIDNEPTRASVAGLLTQGMKDGTLSEYESRDSVGLAAAKVIQVGQSDWNIIVYGTDEELVPDLLAAQRKEKYFMLTLGLTVVMLGAAAAFPATAPLKTLQQEAQTDSLTDLPNRRSILTAGAVKLSSSPVGIALIDLDHFKLVNDTHGHAVGDEVLVELASRLRKSTRPADISGRLGGEEFLVVFDATEGFDMDNLCERVRTTIGGTPFETTIGNITVTASIGMSIGEPGDTFVTLLRLADDALYLAKERGRNQIAMLDSDTEMDETEADTETEEVAEEVTA